MNRFLSCYRDINQFNDYIWRAYKIGSPINRDFVLEFYSKNAFELSDIQSTGHYFYIFKVIEIFMIGTNLKSEKQNIIKSYESYVKASKAEYTCDVSPLLNDYLNKNSNREVNEVLRELIYDTWHQLLCIIQKFKSEPYSIEDSKLIKFTEMEINTQKDRERAFIMYTILNSYSKNIKCLLQKHNNYLTIVNIKIYYIFENELLKKMLQQLKDNNNVNIIKTVNSHI